MLLTSGLNFGFRRTWPTLLGVDVGFSFLTLCVGLGLGAVFVSHPILYTIIKYAGAAYMLYLAWVIAVSEPPDVDATSDKQPIGFYRAAALQWVNPKGCAMAVSAVSGYSAIADYPANIFLMVAFFMCVGIGSSATWAGLGLVMQKFLHRPKIVRAFNIAMAMLLAASLYPVFADMWR
jgi:threonine/homoserine/homoserine lactone efflux protein